MTTFTFAMVLLFPLGLAIAAISDLFSMAIPNRICAGLLAAFFVAAPLSGMGLAGIGMALLAGLTVFAACFALFALNVMGGGDAKLLTVAAVWYGFNPALTEFLIVVSYFGGFLTILLVILRSQSQNALAMGIPLPDSMVGARKIPYGIAIAVGGFLTFGQAPIYSLAVRQVF